MISRTANAMKFVMVVTYLAIAGCSYQTAYNPTYVPDEDPQFLSHQQALLWISNEQANYVYDENPSTFVGSGTSLSIPVGVILSNVAAEVLRDRFSGGVRLTNKQTPDSRCCLTLAPSIRLMDYEQHLGYTASIELELHVEFIDKSGHSFFTHTYTSGVVETPKYAKWSQDSADAVSALIHRTIYELLETAFDDAQQLIIQRL